MTVSAVRADAGGLYRNGGQIAFRIRVTGGENRALHPVSAALVVDDGLRPEFVESQKSRTGKERLPRARYLASRDEGEQRQAGKIVAGKKSFGSEVSVGVEVGVKSGLF